MIDFDKKFQNYFEKWVQDNAGKYTYDEMEDRIPQIYDEWLNVSDEDLCGKSANEYVNQMSAAELIGYFVQSYEVDMDPGSVILDRIEEVPECAEPLKALLDSDKSDVIKISAANLLHEMNKSDIAVKPLISWLFSFDESSDLKDVAVEILVDYADEVKEEILSRIDELTDLNTKTLAAEILVNADKDERTYALLCELFESRTNVALHSGYLAKYGDERAAAMLYKALDDCNYLEFTEIRNAIEILGGVVDDDFRDFSEDEYYKAIKNLK